MACCAGASLIASVVYVDVVIKQHIANGFAAVGLDGDALRAEFDVRLPSLFSIKP